jgi:methylmalonyl-CoA mutase N-terminal domain/subunit
MMKDRYSAKSERSWFMKTHVQTAGCSLTEQQPMNNIVRVAYQAMAAALGGCQSLHTDSMDETLGLPTEQAVTVALRTQQILAHETGVTRVVDPLGGSWFIEHLTDTMESGALDYIAEIDAMGDLGSAVLGGLPLRGGSLGSPSSSFASDPNGAKECSHGWSEPSSGTRGQPGPNPTAPNGGGGTSPKSAGVYAPRSTYGRGVVAGINRGYFRRQIAEASYRFSEECEASDRIIVGVNAYQDPNEQRTIDILQIPHSVEVEQCDRLAKFKAKRDKSKVEKALDNIRAACQGKPYSFTTPDSRLPTAGLHPTNVMPALIDGALANCTLGEMVQAMADIYGRYTGGPEW